MIPRISKKPARGLDREYSIVYTWDMNIRDTIRYEVKTQGLTHAELARRVGTYRPHVVAYLSGRADMNGETLDKLCKVLGLELQRRKGR